MDSTYVFLNSLQESNKISDYLSLLIALLAVFFGPIISYYTAKHTIKHQLSSLDKQLTTQLNIAERALKSQVLSGNRQDWINTLRDALSEFLSILFMISQAKLSKENDLEKSETLLLLRFKISLLLNPQEDDHRQLDTFLDQGIKYLSAISKKEEPNRQFSEIKSDIITLSQTILKREWERVKKVE
ncbi:MAG TPA: hypothetical protein PLZ15_09170 [Melioribacteraceae bacterium]|nr:hypothetical protein [Melioribacteraceae bacterium]